MCLCDCTVMSVTLDNFPPAGALMQQRETLSLLEYMITLEVASWLFQMLSE